MRCRIDRKNILLLLWCCLWLGSCCHFTVMSLLVIALCCVLKKMLVFFDFSRFLFHKNVNILCCIHFLKCFSIIVRTVKRENNGF
jgi:hypothetical protein